MTVQKWDIGLEGNAIHIAEFDEGRMRVMAGPGTGKSFAITRNVQRLLEIGVSPERIFACTFTNVAANELTEKISGINVQNANKVKSGTIHSFCLSILFNSDFFKMTGRNPRPLLDYELDFLYEDLKSERFGHKKGVEKLLKKFKASWASSPDLDPGWPHNPLEQSFQAELLAWLKFHNAMLLDELIFETSRYIHNTTNNMVSNSFDHVIVDEYQDLNKAEQALIELINPNKSILIVGDADQSIYCSLKYAFPEGIREYGKLYPDVVDETLDTCRRCPTTVIDMANKLISFNQNRDPNLLKPHSSCNTGVVKNLVWESFEEEARGLAELVKVTIDLGMQEPGDILILMQNNKFGDAVFQQLDELDVPVINYFSKGILKNKPSEPEQAKPLESLALLQYLANENDLMALRVFVGAGHKKLVSEGWIEIMTHCNSSGDDLKEALEKIAALKLNVKLKRTIQERYVLLKTTIEQFHLMKKHEVLDILFPASEAWANGIRETIQKVDLTTASYSDVHSKILNCLKLVEDPSSKSSKVRVMSLHKSKGLTSKMVIVGGVLDGLIPHISSNQTVDEQERELEEQRRLFYVSITRPTETLILSRPKIVEAKLARSLTIPINKSFYINGINYYQVKYSEFLDQLGPKFPRAENGTNVLNKMRNTGSF